MSLPDFHVHTYYDLYEKAKQKRSLLQGDQFSLLDNSDSLSKPVLFSYSTDLPDQDLRVYSMSLLFLSLSSQPISQADSQRFSKVLYTLLDTLPDLRESIISKFCTSLVALISDAKGEDLNFWLDLIVDLDKKQCNMETPKKWLKCQYIQQLYSAVTLFKAQGAVDLLKNTAKLVQKLQNCGISIESVQDIVFSSGVDYLINKYDLYEIKAAMGEAPVEVNGGEIREIISNLKRIANINEMNQSKLKIIEDKYGEIPVIVDIQAPAQVSEKKPKVIPMEDLLVGDVDIGQVAWRKKPVYFRDDNRMSVEVKIGALPNGKLIGRKTYSVTNDEDRQSIASEIQILTVLSNRSSPENCYIKFYGATMEDDDIILYMDAYEKNLMTLISELKERNEKIPMHSIELLICKLIPTFAEMASLGINHRDIKPHNMLVASQDNVKIIDFGVSERIVAFEITMNPTGMNRIQGTQGYMAPEIEEIHAAGKKTGKFRPGKADVFSLGLTIYQIITLEVVTALNIAAQNQLLMKKINDLAVSDWVRILLKEMCKLDYKTRPTFKGCLRYLPGRFTTEGRSIAN